MSPPRYAQRLWSQTCEANAYEPGQERHKVLATAFVQRLMAAGVPAYVMGRGACPCCNDIPHDTVAVPGHVMHMDVHASNLAEPELAGHPLTFGAHWNIPPMTWCEMCGSSEYEEYRFNLDADSRRCNVRLCSKCADIVGVDTYRTRDLIIGWSPHHATRTLAFAGPAGNSLRRMIGSYDQPGSEYALREFYSKFICINIHHKEPWSSRPGRTVSAAWARELDSLVEASANVIVVGAEAARALELNDNYETHFDFPVRVHPTGKKVLCIEQPGNRKGFWTPAAVSRLYSAVVDSPLNSEA